MRDKIIDKFKVENIPFLKIDAIETRIDDICDSFHKSDEYLRMSKTSKILKGKIVSIEKEDEEMINEC